MVTATGADPLLHTPVVDDVTVYTVWPEAEELFWRRNPPRRPPVKVGSCGFPSV
jgi:hypothetical protein